MAKFLTGYNVEKAFTFMCDHKIIGTYGMYLRLIRNKHVKMPMINVSASE